MSSKPNARYDWNTYMPKMVELHATGMTIPKIHAKIQDPARGFTPSLSILYEKFRSEGYSTKYTRTSVLHPVRTSMGSATVAGNEDGRNIQVPTLPSTNVQSILDPHNSYLPNEAGHLALHIHTGSVPDHVLMNRSSSNQSLDRFGFTTNSWQNSSPQNVQDSGPLATNYLDMPWSDMALDSGSGGQAVNPDPWVASMPYSTLNMEHPGSGKMTLPEADTSRWSMETDVDMGGELGLPSSGENEYQNQLSNTNQKRQRNTLDNTSLPDRSSKRNSSPAESVPCRPVSWITSKRGFNRSVSPDNRLSTGSPRDSGYASGRSSLLVPIAEDTPPHPESVSEFNGLYRVPCHGLHEPQPSDNPRAPQYKDIFKNTAACDHCLYSGIHNLSWSVQHLTLQEFQAELSRDKLYDILAVDAAGNTALHYAAAGGASYEHFLALIEAGVNPYQINTVGQLFLHCMWPRPDSPGGTSITLFTFDLVNLLNSLEPRGAVAALRWRDNEGRTVLDAIAAQITSHDITTQTFQLVKDAGYPLEMSQRFGVPQLRNRRSNLQQPTPQSNDGTSPMAQEAGFATNQSRQQRAYEIIGRATDEPSYVDPDTGDNILHALARLKLSDKGSLLSKIRKFISKDVDLNVHNRGKDTPLTAFIRERPFSGVESGETGATMSKYLDALLWKDARHRVPNKINVNLKNREGATALYYAAVRARPDSVRSLIEAGANVNSRIEINGQYISILQATRNEKARTASDRLKVHLFDNVISYLEHDGAVPDPTVMQERRVCENSVTVMPM
ncbi:hypothetical protein BKA65DRAFT_548411 [Rhexocercosporidium sp. MPI-PUGE-AT-0058]|nr:hypothetical protein BKA65DRAFT_548411 [Rhexocercosporidium sp. MPI-PUGE-AT-0058]